MNQGPQVKASIRIFSASVVLFAAIIFVRRSFDTKLWLDDLFTVNLMAAANLPDLWAAIVFSLAIFYWAVSRALPQAEAVAAVAKDAHQIDYVPEGDGATPPIDRTAGPEPARSRTHDEEEHPGFAQERTGQFAGQGPEQDEEAQGEAEALAGTARGLDRGSPSRRGCRRGATGSVCPPTEDRGRRSTRSTCPCPLPRVNWPP